MASSNQPKYHMLNTTPCWSYWKYEVAMGTGTVTGGIFPSSGFLIGVRLSSASAARLTPLAGCEKTRPVRSVPSESLLPAVFEPRLAHARPARRDPAHPGAGLLRRIRSPG